MVQSSSYIYIFTDHTQSKCLSRLRYSSSCLNLHLIEVKVENIRYIPLVLRVLILWQRIVSRDYKNIFLVNLYYFRPHRPPLTLKFLSNIVVLKVKLVKLVLKFVHICYNFVNLSLILFFCYCLIIKIGFDKSHLIFKLVKFFPYFVFFIVKFCYCNDRFF